MTSPAEALSNNNESVKSMSLSDHELTEQINNGAILITATQRLSQQHMQRYQHQQSTTNVGCWETPTILTIRSWMHTLHATALATGLSEVSVVPAILAEQQWRQIVEADDAVMLLDSDGAARSAIHAWELSCAWDCKSPEDHYLSTDQQSWQRWADTYSSWLSSRDSIDESMLADELIRIMCQETGERINTLLPPQVIVDGFVSITTQMQRFMQKLVDCGTEVIMLSASPSANIIRTSYSDDQTELLNIATQMRAALERDIDQRLALVVNDLQSQRTDIVRAFNRVFYPAMTPAQIDDQPLAYVIEAGDILSNQPLVNCALRILRFCVDSVEGHEISALLLSPHWTGGHSEIRQREILDRHLRERRVRTMNPEQLARELQTDSHLIRALDKVISLRLTDTATLSQWAARFSQCLNAMGWPGDETVDRKQHEALSAWIECLENMQLIDHGNQVSAVNALAQLQLLVSECTVQDTTDTAPIQILSSADSHGLTFDCLWIAGMDIDQWPPAASPNPLLLIQTQKDCLIPDSSPSARLALSEIEFSQWASHCPTLIISHSQTRSGNETSPAALPEINIPVTTLSDTNSVISHIEANSAVIHPASTIAQEIALESVIDTHGPQLAAGMKVAGGAYLFENQSACPFRAFALHRLKIRPLEEVGLGLDARQRGTLLHSALEYFWRDVQSHERLCSMDSDSLDTAIAAVVTRSLHKHQVTSELQTLEHARLCDLLREWLIQCELPRKPFSVVQLECKHRIEHGGITMDVIIDRIDEVDGHRVAIDYKSGTNNSISTWADDRIAKPQLPLYVLTDDRIEAAGYAQVASNQCKFSGVASQGDLLPNVSRTLSTSKRHEDTETPIADWRGWRAHWQLSLDAIARELRDGVATVTPTKDACTYCELKPLCRQSDN